MWDPWQEMRRLQREMEHLVARVPALRWPLRGEYPPLNVIHGERNAEPGIPEESYHRRERPLGTFTRTVSVGEHLDGDKAQATYTNGILRVQLAGAEAAPKKIAIQS